MIYKYVIIFLAAITFTVQAMEKQFDLTNVVILATRGQGHQPFIEAYFAEQFGVKAKQERDLLLIYLQSSVHNQTREQAAPAEVKQCLLTHLQLAYYKKEQAYLQSALGSCNSTIESLTKELVKK